MLTLRLPVSLLVQEYLQLKLLHSGCIAATKENLPWCCKLANMGRWVQFLMYWDSALGVTVLGTKIKEYMSSCYMREWRNL